MKKDVRIFSLVALLVLGTTAGCSKDGANNAQAAPAAASTAGLPEVLATVGDDPITLKDVRERVGGELDKIETDYLRARSQTVEKGLELILQDRVLGDEAKKKGKTLDELVMAEAGGTFEPSEIEISTWYSENQNKVGGRTLDQVRTQIADLLRRRKRATAEERLGLRLNKERKVAVKFQPFRLAFNNEKAPILGKAGAKISVVEFSDFQCPFCKQFAPNLRQIERDFGDKVEVVYRQYPIPSLHPFAIKAAEASLCANEQGKFWELHDLMFAEQDRLGVSDLKEKARRLGMNEKKFASCLDTGRYTEQVQHDMDEGKKAGVTGTPAVFVNGVEIPGGAVPYETISNYIQRMIDREARGE
jgi:protein-disulfide isomerase